MSLLSLPPLPTEVIIESLSTRELACLSNTCRALRALLAPEPIWKAAAPRTHAPSHPVHRAASVRQYLSQQRRVHAAISAQRCQAVQLQGAPGLVSRDVSKVAAIKQEASRTWLHVSGLSAGTPLLARWRLSRRQDYVHWPGFQAWDQSGHYLALGCGGE